MTYFHGTDTEIDFTASNPMRGRYDLCLTDEREVAEGYAEEMGGDKVYELAFEGVASEPEEVVEIADAHGLNDGPERIEADSPYFYLLIDDPAVQDALAAEGIHAVEYEDEDWDNEIHTCLRVFTPGKVRPVA